MLVSYHAGFASVSTKTKVLGFKDTKLRKGSGQRVRNYIYVCVHAQACVGRL